MPKQNLVMINLDKLVEEIAEPIEDNLQRLSYKKLESRMMDNPYTVLLNNADYLSLFKLIAEQPQKAIGLLEKVAKYQCAGERPLTGECKNYCKESIKPKRAFVKKAKQNRLKEFSDGHIQGPVLHWWITCELLAIVKYKPPESLSFFQKGYELMLENNKKDQFWSEPMWDETNKEIRIVIQALRTRSFSRRVMHNNLRLKLTPLDLYKENSEAFIKYFSNIENVEEKKIILKSILDYDFENKEVIDWLNNTNLPLIRDAVLEPNEHISDKSGLSHLARTFVHKEEIIQVPKKYLKSSSALSKYLMRLEKASLADVGFIKHGGVLIPRKGDPNWREGVYIVQYLNNGKDDHRVYKTEKYHKDEELISKTTKSGSVIRYSPGRADRRFVLLDLELL